jgi:protein-L-isoaspartate O-methyltransferase
VSRPDMPDSQYEFKPFKYSSHYWILKALRGEKAPVRILDVGTATGYLGKIWRRSGHYVAGIEYDAAAAEKAREYYDAFLMASKVLRSLTGGNSTTSCSRMFWSICAIRRPCCEDAFRH